MCGHAAFQMHFTGRTRFHCASRGAGDRSGRAHRRGRLDGAGCDHGPGPEILYEKIDGHAESFIDYKICEMAYTRTTQPAADESNEVQLFIFEMSDPVNALGKFRSEQPEGRS